MWVEEQCRERRRRFVGFRVTEEELVALDLLAEKEGRTISDAMRALIRDVFEQQPISETKGDRK